MTRSIAALSAAAALAVPAVALAADEPTQQDRQNAAAECRAERGTTPATREAFAAKYGTNKNKRNAFGKCVSSKSADEAKEREDAQSSAAQQCRTEQGTTAESRAAFATKYGTNKNKRNAFGKCVSSKSQEAEEKADAKDAEEAQARQSAAEQCDKERGTTAESRAAFATKYGTNHNKRNAFGKCVSQKAKAQQQQPQPS